ncbi:hypothetical protein GCM10023063_32030 [Arthrobacter methylotrophus]|uniref:Uncharacterized protein n=1 Tax=Arthrobacter methylotrophus TaxID=121291 RepID=A0ABV5UV56_9MICC
MHHFLIALATTPSPSPTPSLRPGLSEDQVTPGTWGFVLTAFIVVLTTFLIVDMVRRIRRVRYRAQAEEAQFGPETDGPDPEGPEPEGFATDGTDAEGVVSGKQGVEDSDGDAGTGAR